MFLQVLCQIVVAPMSVKHEKKKQTQNGLCKLGPPASAGSVQLFGQVNHNLFSKPGVNT